MKVNMRKISALTGFSPATVSNALNHKHGVNAQTAATIIAKAKELGYYEETRITRIIFTMFKKKGFIVEDTPFFTQMIAGVESECRKSGLDLIISNLDQRDPDYEEKLKALCEDRNSAIILLGTEMLDEDMGLIEKIQSPMVVIDYWNENMTFDSILINNADSARMATEYLIRMGHARVGYLKGDFRIKPFRSRFTGYRTALEKAGLPLEEKYTANLKPTLDGAYQDMRKYLDTHEDLPTAFFAENDILALGAMRAMEEKGIRIPEEISVVGFDDISFSSISNPPLTTIRVPKQEMGRVAVRRILDIIEDNDDLHLKIQVCTEFVIRSSVKDGGSQNG